MVHLDSVLALERRGERPGIGDGHGAVEQGFPLLFRALDKALVAVGTLAHVDLMMARRRTAGAVGGGAADGPAEGGVPQAGRVERGSERRHARAGHVERDAAEATLERRRYEA